MTRDPGAVLWGPGDRSTISAIPDFPKTISAMTRDVGGHGYVGDFWYHPAGVPMPTDQDQFNELAFYTLSQRGPRFIHQHVVDAYAAQHADEQTKPIKVVFSLVGLYLFLEKDFTGRQVQQMHMRLARRRKQWPRLPLPSGSRGDVTVSTVLAAPPGSERDAMVRAWCASVWQTWQESRPQIVNLLKQELDIH